MNTAKIYDSSLLENQLKKLRETLRKSLCVNLRLKKCVARKRMKKVKQIYIFKKIEVAENKDLSLRMYNSV